MRIVVASGKGGTGKTTIVTNLAYVYSKKQELTCADTDVEEPNLALFFPTEYIRYKVTTPIPVIDPEICSLCGMCGELCQFGALVVLKDRVLKFSDLCHSCGGCKIVCPVDAIDEEEVEVGELAIGKPSLNLKVVSGELKEGDVRTTVLIRAVKTAVKDDKFVLFDAPPGAACPAIEAIDESDLCLLVTEPTPFGLHDLKQIIEVVRVLKIRPAVVINRSIGDGDADIIKLFCEKEVVPVLMEILYDPLVAYQQANGEIISKSDPKWYELFEKLGEQCIGLLRGTDSESEPGGKS